MDQLLPLIAVFKDMSGEAVLNVPKLQKLNLDEISKLTLKTDFNTLSSWLKMLSENLSQTQNRPYIAISRELFEQLQNLNDLIFRQETRLETIDTITGLYQKIKEKAVEYLQELKNPSRIDYLPITPYSVFWTAVYSLDSAVMNPLKSSYLRRLAMVSMSGGIPVDLLLKPELSDFPFKPGHFQSNDLLFNHPSDGTFRDAIAKAEEIVDRFSSQCHSALLNEATLRMLFWDPIVCLLRSLFLDSPTVIVSEYSVGTVLQLDSSKIIDICVLFEGLNVPILSIEAAMKYLDVCHRHKDFSKLCCMMTSSVAREAEFFGSKGWDPVLARAFGILIGSSGFQFVVAHPVIDIEDAESFHCYVSITSKEHWLLDLLQPIGHNQNDINAPRPARHGSDQIIGPDRIPDELKISNRDIYHRNTMASVNLEESLTEEVATATGSEEVMMMVNPLIRMEEEEPTGVQLKKYSFEELILFFKHVNEHLTLIHSLSYQPRQPGTPRKPHLFQTRSYVPTSVDSSSTITPASKRVCNVQRGSGQVSEPPRSPLSRNRPQRTLIRKPLSFEHELYTRHFKLNRMFPVIYSNKFINDPDQEGKTYVEYVFEYMEPLVEGNRMFGCPCFSPLVRAGDFDSLLLEAATFALHTLFGLHFLHESLQVVHSDISPDNVMFSHVDQCWKLNDFGSALRLEDSLKCKRSVGTPRFIAPESIATGIFNKNSDIYSLGSVLYLTFHLKLMFFLEMGDDDESKDYDDDEEEEEEDELGYKLRIKVKYDEFFRIVQKMIRKNAETRPTALDLMNDFLILFDRFQLKEFEPYGANGIILQIRALVEESSTKKKNDLGDIPLQSIM